MLQLTLPVVSGISCMLGCPRGWFTMSTLKNISLCDKIISVACLEVSMVLLRMLWGFQSSAMLFAVGGMTSLVGLFSWCLIREMNAMKKITSVAFLELTRWFAAGLFGQEFSPAYSHLSAWIMILIMLAVIIGLSKFKEEPWSRKGLLGFDEKKWQKLQRNIESGDIKSLFIHVDAKKTRRFDIILSIICFEFVVSKQMISEDAMRKIGWYSWGISYVSTLISWPLIHYMNPMEKILLAAVFGCTRHLIIIHDGQLDSTTSQPAGMMILIMLVISGLVEIVDHIRREQQQEEEQSARESARRQWLREHENRKQRELERQASERRESLVRNRRGLRRRSSNNHDDRKISYRTREEADEVIARMRSQGCDSRGTLRSYFNDDYGQWFVGNGW